MVKGLALSGGGARGSFQMGAIDCLYTTFGYRPDVIAGTSVGSINALVLAQANTDSEKLAQMVKLRSIWRSLNGPGDFYTNQPWLAALTKSLSLDFGAGLSVRVEDVVVQAAFNNLVSNAKHSTSLASLTPLENKMRDPSMVDKAKLAKGVPLRMASVSLESGRLRYATGDGRFLEDDNRTPVASALPTNAIAGLSNAQFVFVQAVAAVRALVEAIEYEEDKVDNTKWERIAQLRLGLDRATWHAEAAYDRLAKVHKDLGTPLDATIDPIRGALASAAIPGIFGPYEIGQEHYVDGGVRDVVPVRAAVQLGATEVIAVVAATQNLPRAGYKGSQNFFAALLTSLTDISLKEVVEDDLAGRGVDGTPVTAIIPSFNVHDTAVVDPGLIDINMAYGYLRAADVMSVLSKEARGAAMQLSDAIARIRTETHLLSLLWSNPNKPGAHAMLQEFRFRKWLIRKLVEARIDSKVALPPLAMLWFQTWETGASVFVTSPWSAFTTISQTTPAVAPYSFVPSGFVFDQEGDLNALFIVQAGAAFHGTASTIGAVGSSTPALTVPAGTTDNLPRIPVAGTVVAEAAPGGGPVTTPGTWFVDGKRRYLLNAAAIAAMPPLPATTFVPVGGLTQIPDGGDVYWVGGLVVSNSLREVIHEWTLPTLDEGSKGSTAFLLWNRSPDAVLVTSARITTTADTQAQPVFTVRGTQPFTVKKDELLTVVVDFVAPKPGPVTGMIEVTCNDPIAKNLRIPVSTSVEPLGPHGELSLTPETIDFGKHLVGSTTQVSVTVTNTGGRRAYPTFGVASVPSGQYSVDPYAVPDRIEPGASVQVDVTYTPSGRGASQGMFVIDMESGTDIAGVTYKHRYEVPLSGTASMPTIFVAARALPPVVPHPHLPPIGPPVLPQIVPELTVLDFGAPAPGTNSTRSFWLRNIGDAPLTVSGVVRMGPFGITNPGVFPATIAAGGELEVGADFLASTRPGEVSAGEFSIESDDPLRAKATLLLKGSAAGPHLVEANEQFDFGSVASGSTTTLTYRSDGTAPVMVERVSLSGHDFSVSSSPTLPTQLPPGNELKLTVTVAATTPGQIADTLVVYHDAKPSGHSQVALRAYVQ